MEKERKLPITLEVNIDPEALRRVVKEGRLNEFVSVFTALAAGHMKAQIVEQLAKGEFGRIMIPFDIDEPYGTGPWPPWPWPPPPPYIGTWPTPESIWGLRQIVREELERVGKL